MNKKTITAFIFSAISSFCSGAYATVLLNCSDSHQVKSAQGAFYSYLADLGVSSRFVKVEASSNNMLTISIPSMGANTLHISDFPYFQVKPERITIPNINGSLRVVETVSKKEIAIAHFMEGRTTAFENTDGICGLTELKDDIGLRQNIVAWAQSLQWGWPDGGPAKWNATYWDKGTPLKKSVTQSALFDALTNQSAYEIGCYTATKLVYSHAYLDYYSRVKGDKAATAKILEVLWQDGDPLVGIEPSYFWDFEPGYSEEAPTHGKLLTSTNINIAKGNFVPGDWSYFLNTDIESYNKTGYEGSNSIYLGRNRFDDYYNDNDGYYSFEEKLDEIYQWKNKVFSRAHHVNNIKMMRIEDLLPFANSPAQGGYLVDKRIVPKTLAKLGVANR